MQTQVSNQLFVVSFLPKDRNKGLSTNMIQKLRNFAVREGFDLNINLLVGFWSLSKAREKCSSKDISTVEKEVQQICKPIDLEIEVEYED